MNIVFIGGGSLRILPIVRALFQTPEVFDGGSIRLVDLKLERAEAVGRLICRCPEYQNVNCKVSWTSDADRALEGADLFYLTTAIEREPSDTFAAQAAGEYGYLHSDQLSINGSFLAARAGNMVMNFARKMERYCPEAMMLIFANPVAVFSAAVTNYTKIKALGICAGFGNCRWDLPRICGRDRYESEWNIVAAGVNHLSFILRGEYQGKDWNALLQEQLDDAWEPMPITSSASAAQIQEGLRKLVAVYRRFGSMIFSSEFDGMGHILWPWALEKQQRGLRLRMQDFNPATVVAENLQKIERKFLEFSKAASSQQEPDWRTPINANPLFGIDFSEISVPIIRAVAGLETMRITASHPNLGAVRGFSDQAALEYTMDLHGKNIVPVENQYIPSPFQGLIASLSEHQTLMADAIARQDGRLFADALEAYPMNKFSVASTPFFRRMFEIFSDLPPALCDGVNHLDWKS
jgi:alpha-galactosidase/6-phospho-beta-glucosidase family protein